MSCKMQLKGTKFVDLMVLVGFVKMKGATITFNLKAFHCAVGLNYYTWYSHKMTRAKTYIFVFLFGLFWESTNQFLRCTFAFFHTYCVHNLVATSNYLSCLCPSMVSNPPDLWPSEIFWGIFLQTHAGQVCFIFFNVNASNGQIKAAKKKKKICHNVHFPLVCQALK